MERQAGLGRSLEDVLDSLTPVEPDPAGPGRTLFEPEDLERQLDKLMGDIAALRERVQHLVALVPEDAVLRVVPDPERIEETSKKKQSKKKSKGKDKTSEDTKGQNHCIRPRS
jgi:regulator of replication initiation timing